MCECDQIFTKFQWEGLVSVGSEKLPENAGVYVIRVRKRGKPVGEVILHTENFLKKIKWPPFSGYVLNRVNRLKKIGKCPTIYIGAAPTSLQGRYKDLCGRRHTAFFPILALLMTGWKLGFGWLLTDKPEEIEKFLKRQYIQIHGALPALVKR